ncbi:MAG: RNA polymerase sigma factor [Myxococcales bacterium]|nr:RNA polymerase sigma factor [Myxococcales bacterium]
MSVCATTPDALVACSAASPTFLDFSEFSDAPLEARAILDDGSASPERLGPEDAVPLALLQAVHEHFAGARSSAKRGTLEPRPPSGARLGARGGDTPDEDLALAASSGDPRAAIAIFRRYVVQVRSKLLRWIGGHDLDDHVQDVFSRLFEQLPRLRQPSALRSFLIGITLRVACTELRRRRRWRLRLTATGEVPEIPWHAHDDGTAREALSRFEDILGKLAPRTRRVFVLRYVEKLELVDVAAAMDISLATAKRHLSRASMRVFAMAEREPALADYLREMKPRAPPTLAAAS